MLDPDFFVDRLSVEDLSKLLKKNKLPKRVGFHTQSEGLTKALILVDAIHESHLTYYGEKVRFPVPLQLPSSSFDKFTTDFIFNDFLFEAVDQNKVTPIFHAPFWVNLFAPHASYQNTYLMKWAQSFNSYCRSILQTKVSLVVHINYPKEKADGTMEADNILCNRFMSNLQSLSQVLTSVNVLIENQAGSSKSTSVSTLDALWKTAKASYPREESIPLGFCVDTEHAHANAETFSSEVLARTFLYHLNSAPSSVLPGSHKDLHSWSFISRCVHPTLESEIIKAVKSGRMCILERRSLEVVVSDLVLLGNLPE